MNIFLTRELVADYWLVYFCRRSTLWFEKSLMVCERYV